MPRKKKQPAEAPILDLTKGGNETPYEVLKKVGIPAVTRNGRVTAYPFANLEIDDGFRVPTDRAKNVGMSARAYGKRHGKRFVVRRDPEKEGYHLVVRSE